MKYVAELEPVGTQEVLTHFQLISSLPNLLTAGLFIWLCPSPSCPLVSLRVHLISPDVKLQVNRDEPDLSGASSDRRLDQSLLCPRPSWAPGQTGLALELLTI